MATNGDDGNTGDTWSEAVATVGHALLQAAESGCEVWVAAGTYRPTPVPENPRAATFPLTDGVELYGGFAGHETSREQRDTEVNETVLSGDLAQDDDPQDPESHAENVEHVVTGWDNARIDGFTISAGNANSVGGGMQIAFMSPVVANCRFVGNRGNNGAAMYIEDGSPVISNCTFEQNEVAGVGGAVYVVQGAMSASPRFVGCDFTDNRAGFGGGAVYSLSANPGFEQSSFTDNGSAYGGGGAIYLTGGTLTLVGSTVERNVAPSAAGVGAYLTDAEVTDTLFQENRATTGGALGLTDSTFRISESTFERNEGSMGGGAIYAEGSELTISDTTFRENVVAAGSGGGVLNRDSSIVRLVRSNFEANQATDGGGIATLGAEVSVVSSRFEGNSGFAAIFMNVGNTAVYGSIVRDTVGTGVFVQQGDLLVESTAIFDNAAEWQGGGIRVETGTARVVNSTLSRNTSTVSGGAIASWGPLTIANSILWADSVPEVYVAGVSPTVTHSDIAGWCTEEFDCVDGNLNSNPRFVEPALFDFSLQSTSPGVDSGSDVALEADRADRDADEDVAEPVPFDGAGNPRRVGQAVDIGAYEFVAP